MRNIFYKGIIIEPSDFLLPKIRVSPMTQKELNCEMFAERRDVITTIKNFHGKYVSLGVKARQMLELALLQCNLNAEDVVTILTTSNYLYVSSCITKEVEKFCKWSRMINDKTKAIIVNHEFGYAYPNVKDLRKYGVPIIEDCAQSFLTEANDIGKYGDYVVYSLPKSFPMQLGAVIASNTPLDFHVDKEISNYINTKIAQYGVTIEMIKQQRLMHYHYLEENLKGLGITPFFELTEKTVPGVFLFKWLECINYQLLKDFLTKSGIECSVFYGKNAFFIPLHQNLCKSELDYMIKLLFYFYEKMI